MFFPASLTTFPYALLSTVEAVDAGSGGVVATRWDVSWRWERGTCCLACVV